MHRFCLCCQGRLSAAEMMRVQRFQVIDHSGAGRDLRVIRAGRRELLGAVASVKVVRLRRKGVGQSVPYYHNSLMRTKSLVGRKQVNVWAERMHVRDAVRRVAHAVYARISTCCADFFANRCDSVGCSDNVGAMREAHELNLIVHHVLKIAHVEHAGFWVQLPFANVDAKLV